MMTKGAADSGMQVGQTNDKRAATAAGAEFQVSVEQASYSYAAPDDEFSPQFTLEPLSFAAGASQIVCILGPNASGKSTLLRLLAGVAKPAGGKVLVAGREVSALSARERARLVALVQQESPVLFPLRAWDFVLQGRFCYGRGLRLESPEDSQAAESALAEVGAAELGGRWMSDLSGGEKQRVVLARALAQKAPVLLLDEPTRHLDISGKIELLRSLRRLANGNGNTAVLITHELNLAAQFADLVILLHQGQCVCIGTAAAVYRREFLEPVFGFSMEIERGANRRPRVILCGDADTDAGFSGMPD